MRDGKVAGIGGVVLSLGVCVTAAGQHVPAKKERPMDVRNYPSSIETNLTLTADFYVSAQPKPLCLFFHGWHMDAAGSRGGLKPLTTNFFVVSVNMRGRGGSGGKPDVNGFELIDALDALDFARRTWPEAVAGDTAYVVGGSGGGGNTLALVGKAPDLFIAGAAWAAMSDYALWFNNDRVGEFKDEMQGKGWIGGTPQTNAEAYRARGGIDVLPNVVMPVLAIHGRADDRVPVAQTERYRDKAEALGKTNVTVRFNDRGHGCEEWQAITNFLASHTVSPRLPPAGALRVNSFVACRSFWLVLDSPDRTGIVDYRLDSTGALQTLAFRQEDGAAPVRRVLLRLPGAARAVRVAGGTPAAPTPAHAVPGYTDFTWDCDGPWSVRTMEGS